MLESSQVLTTDAEIDRALSILDAAMTMAEQRSGIARVRTAAVR